MPFVVFLIKASMNAMNMKRTLLAVFITLTLQFSFCPETKGQGYTFSVSTNSYSALSNATVVSSAGWQSFDMYTDIPLGFTFTYWKENYTSITMLADGRISFSNFQGGENINLLTGEISEHKTLNSDISYITEGSAPGRIFKIQVQNAGFTNDVTESAYLNYQIWLYEGSNVLEFRHGSSGNISNSLYIMGGPYYGLTNQEADSFYCLEGNSGNPTLLFNSPPQVVTSFPSSGLTYIFTPKTTGIPKLLELNSPNGGEIWKVGETHTITWNSSGISAVKIEYSTGSSWVVVAASVNAALKTYDWVIPNTPSNSCKVKISEVSGGLTDESSAVFQIAINTSAEIKTASGIIVYPNPSSGNVYLNVPSGFEGQLILVDRTGRFIHSESIHALFAGQKELLLTEVAAGVYFIKLTDHQNKPLESIRLVITR